MLLSDVLNIVYTKSLNEEYKSKILQNLLNPYLDSYACKMPFRPNDVYRKHDGYDFYDILFLYKKLIQDGTITRQDFENPERRDELVNVKYIDRFKTHLDKKRGAPMSRLYKNLRDYGCTIDFSKITDNDLEKIYSYNKDVLQKPKYKYGLLFWIDYYDRLFAVTYKGKTIMYTKSQISLYKNNPSYTGPVDIDEIIDGINNNNQDPLEEFIKNAFIEVPNFDPSFDEWHIKEEGVKNVNKLLDTNRMSAVYFVNPKSMQKLDISDKLATRQEYTDYLMNMFNISKEEIHKGKLYMIKYAKQQYKYKRKETKDIYIRTKIKKLFKAFDEIDIFINDILDNMFVITEQLQNQEIEFLAKDIDMPNEIFTCGSVKLPTDYIPFFKQTLPDKYFYRENYKKSRSEQNTIYPDNLGDLFVLMNAYTQYVIHKTNDLIISKTEFLNVYNKDEKDQSAFETSIERVVNEYKRLKIEVSAVFNSRHIISTVASDIKKYTNIDVYSMFQVFEKYSPIPSYYM